MSQLSNQSVRLLVDQKVINMNTWSLRILIYKYDDIGYKLLRLSKTFAALLSYPPKIYNFWRIWIMSNEIFEEYEQHTVNWTFLLEYQLVVIVWYTYI